MVLPRVIFESRDILVSSFKGHKIFFSFSSGRYLEGAVLKYMRESKMSKNLMLQSLAVSTRSVQSQLPSLHFTASDRNVIRATAPPGS